MIKRALILLATIIFLAIIFLYLPILKADTPTSLTIDYTNVPPIQIATIPNQTWAKNTNLTNAFDLDDYFIDNETLTYNSSSISNILVVIDTTTNSVSFYPDYGFEGTKTVFFTANDGYDSTQSNNITLNVTSDSSPPTWSNMSKDKQDSQITQNTVVTFYTSWQDNIALSSYIFSIKQESGWINQSPSSFSGIQNTSSYAIQISAPGGTFVEWKFYAFDTSGNLNSTDAQNFTVSSSSGGSSGSGGSEDDDEDYSYATENKTTSKIVEAISEFKVEEPEEGFFKVDIKQGTSRTVTIKVTNIGNIDLNFDIDIDGLEEFEKLISDEIFKLTAGESKSVTIEFTADRRLMPGLYAGTITVKSDISGIWEIPIIIIVTAVEVDFDLLVNISEDYKNVRPGDTVKANLTIINLKEIEEREVILYYALIDIKGNVLDSASEEFKFRQSSITFEKELSLPPNIKMGNYIFFARAVSEKAIVIGSDLFEVGEGFSVAGFVKTNILLFLLIISSIIVAFLMMRRHKSKERIRLLSLYLMITELNKLIKEGKSEEAINVYLKIKATYGEPISETAIENKGQLKKEMETFSEKLDSKVLQRLEKRTQEQQKNEKQNPKEEDKIAKKEGQEKDKQSEQKERDTKQEDKKLEKEIGKKLEEAKEPDKA